MNVVSIMQPTYLPWMGYMAMINDADLFVLLDTVPISHQSWQTRNRVINSQGNETWLSIPVHDHEGDLLHDVMIDNTKPWRRKHKGTLNAISNEKHIMREILAAYDESWLYLTEFTTHMLREIVKVLGITTAIVSASDYGLPVRANPFDRLAEILERTGATEFLTASGSSMYLDWAYIPVGGNPNFIPIRYAEHTPVRYPQSKNDFVPQMSVLDALARHGVNETNWLIRAGSR